MASEIQASLFDKLTEGLSADHKAEFFQVLHEAGISPDDVELARLLKALQIYKAYYESIPTAIQSAVRQIEMLKQDIEIISTEAKEGLDAGALLAGQVIEEAKKVHQDVNDLNLHVDEAMRNSTKGLMDRLVEFMASELDGSLVPLKNRLDQLSVSTKAFDDAIARNSKATAALQKSTSMARRLHLWTYAICSLVVICSLAVACWIYLDRRYEARIDAERQALASQMKMNRSLLLQLARSQRSLELLSDPKNPRRSLLVMEDATGWQSNNKQGVIEFTK